MKVYLKYPMRAFAGLNSNKTMVYRSCRNYQVFIGSSYTPPRITEHNHKQGTKLTQANILYKAINKLFIQDLKIYAEAYNKKYSKKKRLPPNFYNIFIKALCNGAVRISDLNSVQSFVSLYGNTIQSWIANKLLPKVNAKFIGVSVWMVDEIPKSINVIHTNENISPFFYNQVANLACLYFHLNTGTHLHNYYKLKPEVTQYDLETSAVLYWAKVHLPLLL